VITASPGKSPLPEPDASRMGGIALKNGLILVTENHWVAAIRQADGSIDTASGTKATLPAKPAGERRMGIRARSTSVPFLRGLERFGETLVVLGLVKKRLPHAQMPLEGGRVALALAASLVATQAVRAVAGRSAVAEEVGTAVAGFVPAVLALKGSAISGYHGAEHKVIGGHEVDGDSASAAKEHDRCGSNLVGPYLLASIATGLLARGRSGVKSPAASAVAGVASLGLALEALRWSTRHGDSLLARLMLSPGRAIQKSLTTSEPTPDQLEVGERALAELLRLENAAG
jgi:uncharacterized protein YqhQ